MTIIILIKEQGRENTMDITNLHLITYMNLCGGTLSENTLSRGKEEEVLRWAICYFSYEVDERGVISAMGVSNLELMNVGTVGCVKEIAGRRVTTKNGRDEEQPTE